jgi:flavin-dependent dehydrogenase
MQRDSSETKRLGAHAVVIGASMAGLLSARVLANHFDKVTLIERDKLPENSEPRKGVPQARHIHVVLQDGMDFIEEVFPGFKKDMVASGSNAIDSCRDIAWYTGGVWRARPESGQTMYAQTRYFVDWHMARRIRQVQNVHLREGHEVLGLMHDAAGQRVTGARIRPINQPDGEELLEADLVVDASGRGTRSPRWLEELGYGRPEEVSMPIDICYVSRLVRPLPGNTPDWKVLAVYGTAPKCKRTGVIIAVENDSWIVSLVGYHGDHCPTDDAGFLEFASKLERPDLYEALKNTEPLTPIVAHKVPTDQRYFYERMERFPDGLVVLGDATLSFNPIFAQGIAISARGVMALKQGLEQAATQGLKGMAPRVVKQGIKSNEFPWMLVCSEDLRFPETVGERPLWLGPANWFKLQLSELSSVDNDIAMRFMKVFHTQSSIGDMAKPGVLFKALKWGLGLRGGLKPAIEERPKVQLPAGTSSPGAAPASAA